MKRLWKGCLLVALGLAAQKADAQQLQWQPAPSATPRTASGPMVFGLGTPEPAAPVQAAAPSTVRQTNYATPAPTSGWVVRGQQPDDPLYGFTQFTPPPPPPPPPAPAPGSLPPGAQVAPAPGPFNTAPPPPPAPNGAIVADPSESFLCGVKTNSSGGPGWFDNVTLPDAVKGSGSRGLFQSDHTFDNFISPVSNPFFAEDPRSLTEVKPLFLYQHIPSSNYATGGGNIFFYGLQARLAVTDMFSIVVDKLGFVTTQPNTDMYGFSNNTGFAELSLGPKFTFLRIDSTKTVLAAGLKFDIAAGDSKVEQSVGNLSLVPYFSAAQCLGKTNWGTFNFMNTTGFSFATDSTRNDFFYSSFHVDFDVANLNKIFPLIELNYFYYPNNGGNDFYGFTGGDLFNLGSQGVAGQNDLSIAFGARYKFCEWAQVGAAFELPLVGEHNSLDQYRFTLDVIFRY